jgi:hypothetical protein
MAYGKAGVKVSRSDADSCVYVFRNAQGDLMGVLAIHVDDILSAGEDEWAEALFEYLAREVDIHDVELVDKFLGLHIMATENGYCLSQEGYVKEVLKRFQMEACRPVSAPASTERLSSEMSPQTKEEEAEMADKPYRQLCGALLWIARMTRPDISYAVRNVCAYAHCPGPRHWQAAMRILKYLKGTADYTLPYRGVKDSDSKDKFKISGYCDADWGNDLDTRRSITGYVTLVNDNPVSWTSSRQRCVAQSTTEAEYISLSEVAKEVYWLRSLLASIVPTVEEQCIKLHVDNQSAIYLANSRSQHDRSKHIEVRAHYVRDLVTKDIVELEYVPSQAQLADALTKAVNGPSIRRFCELLRLPPKCSSLEKGGMLKGVLQS